LRLLLTLLLIPSVLYGKDIVAPSGRDIRIITKPGGTSLVSVKLSVDPNETSSNVFAIGEIQQSILTEAQFQAQMGTGWVQMKGQPIAGSKLCTEYSLCTLPDARNRFLRNSDGSDTNLRGTVDDTTAKNGLGLTWEGTAGSGSSSLSWTSTTFLTSGNHPTWNSATASSQYPGVVPTMRVVNAGSSSAPSRVGDSHTVQSLGSNFKEGVTWTGSLHTHAFNKNNFNDSNYQVAHSHSYNKNGLNSSQSAHSHSIDRSNWNSDQVWAQNSETAPDHIIVNTFVKIN
jgi:hypothetical protein